jgi:A/G-specific adenine glycosylase
LWGGLLVPPEGEPEPVLARLGLHGLRQRELPPLKHAFTHFRLTLRPVLCEVAASTALGEPGLEWIALDQAADAGVPTPIRKLIRQVTSARD